MNDGKWECIGFEFPQEGEDYSDSVVKAIIDMRTSPVRISKVEADLLSAAPDLLEACQMALEFVEGNDFGMLSDWDRVDYYLRTAIAKAKGK